MTERRPSDVSVHDWQHVLVERRRREWTETTGRLAKREAAKRAHWTLADHLRQFHGRRVSATGRSFADLQAIHDEAHGR